MQWMTMNKQSTNNGLGLPHLKYFTLWCDLRRKKNINFIFKTFSEEIKS